MRPKLAIHITLAAAIGFAVPAAADEPLFVDITEGAAAPLPISVVDGASGPQVRPDAGEDLGVSLANIVRADLASSPFFRIVAVPRAAGSNEEGLLSAAASVGTQALVIGRAESGGDGILTYACGLYDVFSGGVEEAQQFRVPLRQWRRAAHKCADMVFARVTGYRGHFDTRFALVSPAGASGRQGGRVVAVDSDGANPTDLASNLEIVTMPRLSPDNRLLLFVSYAQDMPQLILADLARGTRTRLQLPPGLPSAARFSPDGRSAVFALSHDGSTDIYEYEFATARTLRLTDTTGIDTNPSLSPDGQSIVFESDRSGQPQLYIMRRDGREQRRISFEGEHASPVWSPDGSLIAFVAATATGRRIGVMTPEGRHKKLLTDGAQDEDPTWAPSGRAIAFQRLRADGSPPDIMITDVSGRVQRSVALPMAGSEPFWSELLP